jgi:hypothetical protein
MMRIVCAILLVLLPGCTAGGGVDLAERAKAERWVRHDQLPNSVTPLAIWHANGLPGGALCGEIEAPEMLKPQHATLRYVYDTNGAAQVEKHEGWITLSGTSQALLDTNRRLFDQLWANHCADHAPFQRRLAAWTGIDLDLMGVTGQAPLDPSVDELRAEMREREKRLNEYVEEVKRLR